MESIKLLVQTDHKFLTRASIFCHCVINVKTLNVMFSLDVPQQKLTLSSASLVIEKKAEYVQTVFV